MTAPRLFDRTALARNRARATALYLQEEVAAETLDRLQEVNRTFTTPAVVTPFPQVWGALDARIVPDDETLALEPETHDLVIHGLCLHWSNDPVGQLIQCRRALKPDGLFIATLFGGETLASLRAALAEAEIAVTGGLSPRIAPMGEIRDLGALLQRAGFALPVADSLPYRVSHEGPLALIRDLRAMGEGNALSDRLRHPTRREVFARAAAALGEGRIETTFEVVTLTGWAPGPGQPQPLRPGSATTRLEDALRKLNETGTDSADD